MRRLVVVAVAVAAVCIGLGNPIAGAATEPLRVVSVDTDKAPEVTITVALPPSLADRPLTDASFEVRESGAKRARE